MAVNNFSNFAKPSIESPKISAPGQALANGRAGGGYSVVTPNQSPAGRGNTTGNITPTVGDATFTPGGDTFSTWGSPNVEVNNPNIGLEIDGKSVYNPRNPTGFENQRGDGVFGDSALDQYTKTGYGTLGGGDRIVNEDIRRGVNQDSQLPIGQNGVEEQKIDNFTQGGDSQNRDEQAVFDQADDQSGFGSYIDDKRNANNESAELDDANNLQTFLDGVEPGQFNTNDPKELGTLATDQLTKLLSGEMTDNFGRQSRDNFAKWAGDARSQANAEIAQNLANGSISAAESFAQQDQMWDGLTKARSDMEFNIQEKRKSDIKEGIQATRQWRLNEANISNIDSMMESRQLQDILATAELLPEKATYAMLSQAIPTLQSIGLWDAETGEIAEKFKEPGAFESLVSELTAAGIEESEAVKTAQFAFTLPYKTAMNTYNASIMELAREMPDDQKLSFLANNFIDATTLEPIGEEAAAELIKENEKPTINISDVWSPENETVYNDESTSPEIKNQIMNNWVEDIVKSNDASRLMGKGDNSDLFKAVHERTSEFSWVTARNDNAVSADRLEFDSAPTKGSLIKAGPRLYKVDSDVIEQNDPYFLEFDYVLVTDVATGKSYRIVPPGIQEKFSLENDLIVS